MTSAIAVNKIWQSLQEKLEILMLCMGILFALMIATVTNGTRPLQALGTAARRFGQGDYSARMASSGPPEMIACIKAFNSMAEDIGALLHSVREGDTRNRLLGLIVEQSSAAIITKDLDGLITSWNGAAAELYGYCENEALGKPSTMLYPAHAQALNQREMPFQHGEKVKSTNEQHVAKDGRVLDILATISMLHGADGNHIGETVIIRDVTRQKQAEEALYKETERAQVTLASIADAVITTDTAGKVEYLNPVAERLLEWRSSEARGNSLNIVFQCEDEATGAPIQNPVDRLSCGSASQSMRGNGVLVSHHGKKTPIQTTAASIHDRSGQAIGSVLVFRDVSSSHSMAQELTWQATHDALTSLVNRREFARCLGALVDSADRESREHAMLYMDLDQFKVVNDTCGHLAGDELLRQLSALLNTQVRASDTLARLGGDEFGVLLKDCNAQQAMDLAEILRATVAEFRFAWDGKIFTVGASIGVVAISGSEHNNADIMALADAACYQAKDNGRNRVQAAPQNRELAHRRSEMLWVTKISAALEEDRLILYCQRIQPLASNGPPHYEVLLRMRDEEGKLVMPMAFIPAAERYNLMQAIDRKVIDKAFQALNRRRLDAPGSSPITLSINLSGISLSDDNLLGYVKQQFKDHNVSPQQICFEITETAAVANLTKAVTLITELKTMGCRFSLDDFGSGLSSFAYLKNLPVDYLKIDGSFVRDMVHDPIDAAMVRAISDIGHVMGLQTIAEWVEDNTTLAMLQDMGIDHAQGYLVGRPQSLESVMCGADDTSSENAKCGCLTHEVRATFLK